MTNTYCASAIVDRQSACWIHLKSTKTQKAPKKTSYEDFSEYLQKNHLDAFENFTQNN